jgi:hypothetical protein
MKAIARKILPVLFVAVLLSSTVLVMLGHAQDEFGTETTTFLYIAPNPVGVGQTVSILGWIQPDPPEGEVFSGLMLKIWAPYDDVEFPQTIGPLNTDFDGYVNIEYVPDVDGKYRLILYFPGNLFESETYIGSQSATFYLTVQQDAVPVGPIVPPGGTVTPGDHVTVFPDPEESRVSLYFEHIASSGTASVSKTTTPPAGVPPLPWILGFYYDFDVTFTFTGPVVVGLPYDETLPNENLLSMWHYEGGVVGDVTGDYKVDWRDLLRIALALGSTPGTRRWNSACDLNGDNRVNLVDLLIAMRNYGQNARAWVDVTTHVDIDLNIVFGSTTNFPPFGIRYK